MSSIYTILVCGGTCSGKTTVCKKILEHIITILGAHEGVVVICSQDSYYMGGNSQTNYDVPKAIDFDAMYDNIVKLQNGQVIDEPVYNFSTHSREDETKKMGPAKIIIIEGILTLSQPKIRALCDLKVFVEADEVVCYTRRLKRDIEERGRTFEEVESRYLDHVVPSFRDFINPSRYHANISLINNTHGSFVGLDILLDHIEKKIHELK